MQTLRIHNLPLRMQEPALRYPIVSLSIRGRWRWPAGVATEWNTCCQQCISFTDMAADANDGDCHQTQHSRQPYFLCD